MRRLVLALSTVAALGVAVPVLGAAPAHADPFPVAPFCVTAGGPVTGQPLTVTVCTPWD